MRVHAVGASAVRFVGAALLVNGLILGLGFKGARGDPNGPPGWLVASAWTVLFALFGLAHGLLRRLGDDTAAERRWIVAFGALCLAYPFYTDGLSNRATGLAGNVVTMLAAIALVRRVFIVLPAAGALIAPVIFWIAYASWTIVRAMRW
jgi:tryptophan-rich sensory protein